jgi:5-methylcytosine-specific restriction endonuclease McrA
MDYRSVARERLQASRRKSSAARRSRLRYRHPEPGRWRRICDRDDWTCWICRAPIDSTLHHPHKMAGTVDHYVPLSVGGHDEDDNLRAAHFSCNSKRGAGRRIEREVA